MWWSILYIKYLYNVFVHSLSIFYEFIRIYLFIFYDFLKNMIDFSFVHNNKFSIINKKQTGIFFLSLIMFELG